MMQKTVQKLMFTFATAAALTFSASITLAADDKSRGEGPSAWEKICLDGTASAACDKASSILSEKLVDTEDQNKETTLRERLVKVSRKGCDTGHLSSCAELIGADDAKESLQLAIGVAKKTCLSHPDPTSASCKYMSEWQADMVPVKLETAPAEETHRSSQAPSPADTLPSSAR
jgi:hypothetical protein